MESRLQKQRNGNKQDRGFVQRYEQEIDRSTIVVVCQPTPLPKLGRSCLRLRGYFLYNSTQAAQIGYKLKGGWVIFL